MPLLDLGIIYRRAAWVHQKAGLVNTGPPYHTHDLFAPFPALAVAGADLPRNVWEMAERGPDGRMILWYNRTLDQAHQRIALGHGLYHFMTDLADRNVRGVRECNTALRELERAGKVQINTIERACDLFCGALLVPDLVLDAAAPDDLFPRAPAHQNRWRDQIDELAALFHVPDWFIKQRLWDLMHLRRTNFYVR